MVKYLQIFQMMIWMLGPEQHEVKNTDNILYIPPTPSDTGQDCMIRIQKLGFMTLKQRELPHQQAEDGHSVMKV